MADLLPAPAPTRAAVDLVLESNHRVANNLAALAATVRHRRVDVEAGPAIVPRQAMLALIDDIAGKIVAVARLYQRFAQHAEDDARDAPRVVAATLQDLEHAGIFGERLRLRALTVGAPCCPLNATQALQLTLAVSEIVCNAVKHAHPTGLPVALSLDSVATADGGALVQVSDDGVGLPEGFVEGRDGGFGLNLIRTLVEGAGGALDVRSDALGLTYAMRFASHP